MDSIAFLLGSIASLFVVWRLFKSDLLFVRFKVTLDIFFDSLLVFFLAFGIGARMLYLVEHWQRFNENFLSWILFLHFPGFIFLGGVIGGFLGLFLFCRQRKLSFLLLSDVIAVGVLLALGIVRLGNFVSNISNFLPLYEAVLSLGSFGFLHYLYTKGRSQSGMTTIYFFLLIGLMRFVVEFAGGYSVYLARITPSQFISGIFVLTGVSVLLFMKREQIRRLIARRI